jgi:chromosome segregation ATPase
MMGCIGHAKYFRLYSHFIYTKRKTLGRVSLGSNTYTEDEMKQLLKNLFAEKKKVKELQKQLEERGIQKKFQTRLADIHKLSLTEEYAKLKTAYLEKEKEREHLKSQLTKVRPALKRLVEDLKSAHAEIAKLKLQELTPKEEVEKDLIKAKCQIEKLTQENEKSHNEQQELKKRIVRLEIDLEELRQKNLSLESAKAEMLNLRKDDLRKLECLEAERNSLVKKLAESLCQIQNQKAR